MLIHLGYSPDLSSDEILKLIDLDPTHPQMTPAFRRAFGTGPLRPGQFEVYGREDFPNHAFDADLVRRVLPLEPGPAQLLDLDFSGIRSAFFIRDDTLWSTDHALGIRITDTIEVDKYSFE